MKHLTILLLLIANFTYAKAEEHKTNFNICAKLDLELSKNRKTIKVISGFGYSFSNNNHLNLRAGTSFLSGDISHFHLGLSYFSIKSGESTAFGTEQFGWGMSLSRISAGIYDELYDYDINGYSLEIEKIYSIYHAFFKINYWDPNSMSLQTYEAAKKFNYTDIQFVLGVGLFMFK